VMAVHKIQPHVIVCNFSEHNWPWYGDGIVIRTVWIHSGAKQG
jgi:hypothetical protein